MFTNDALLVVFNSNGIVTVQLQGMAVVRVWGAIDGDKRSVTEVPVMEKPRHQVILLKASLIVRQIHYP